MPASDLDTVLRRSVDLAAQLARAVDQGGDLAVDHPAHSGPILARTFAELGVFTLDAHRGAGELPDTVRLLEAVAAECLCSAFSIWAHRMVIEYLRASGGHTAVLQQLVRGERAGSIAMATAMQELAGLGSIPLRATPTADGYRVSGRLTWASNIEPGTVVVFPAHVQHTGAAPQRIILWAVIGEPGITVHPMTGLLALDATRSAGLEFTGLAVPRARLIAPSLDAAVARRSTHLTLQTAFCLGLAGRSLAEAQQQLDGAPSVIHRAHSELRARHAEYTAQLHSAAVDLTATVPVAVTRLRLDAARLAVDAARHESTLAGGRGYLTVAPSNRRLREATFLPVQSPSEVQLLTELERASQPQAEPARVP